MSKMRIRRWWEDDEKKMSKMRIRRWWEDDEKMMRSWEGEWKEVYWNWAMDRGNKISESERFLAVSPLHAEVWSAHTPFLFPSSFLPSNSPNIIPLSLVTVMRLVHTRIAIVYRVVRFGLDQVCESGISKYLSQVFLIRASLIDRSFLRNLNMVNPCICVNHLCVW